MTGIDDLVGQMYKSEAQYLVEAGCRDIKKSFDNAFDKEENFTKGVAKLNDARKRGQIDLAPLVNFGYERLQIINSGDEPYRVFQLAKELGSQLDEERIRQNAYAFIHNLATERLELMEKYLGLKPDPQEILRHVYMVFDNYSGNDEKHFWPRAFDALFYAVARGGKVDTAKLPNAEKIEMVIAYKLTLDKRKAAHYLRGFKQIGLQLASPETIATLERIAEIDG